jgi:hypothetical protein
MGMLVETFLGAPSSICMYTAIITNMESGTKLERGCSVMWSWAQLEDTPLAEFHFHLHCFRFQEAVCMLL